MLPLKTTINEIVNNDSWYKIADLSELKNFKKL